jgi:hypothetical protein
MRSLIAPMVLMLAATLQPAAAADWIGAGSTNMMSAYIDGESLSGTVNQLRVWIKYVARKPMPLNDDPQVLFSSGTVLAEIDCSERSMGSRQEVWHDANGNAIKTNGARPAHFVAPETIGADVLDVACTRLKQDQQLSHDVGQWLLTHPP